MVSLPGIARRPLAASANEIAVRYIQGLQHLTGEAFQPDLRPREKRIIESTNLILDSLL